MSNIPAIDIEAWRDGDTGLAATLDRALQESGFLLIEHHSVDATLTGETRAAARQFFRLSFDSKSRYSTTVGGRGWVPPGREANAFYGEVPDTARADLTESDTLGRDFATGNDDIDCVWFLSSVAGPSPGAGRLVHRYTDALRVLYLDLLEMCAAALGLPRDWFARQARLSPHTLNINRYPPLTETGPPLAGQFRIAPHTDWGVITILDRQPGYGGLQVQNRNGVWEDAPYREDAFTVNIGDPMAPWTGDRWRSTRHEVLPPSAEAPDEELISLILFLEADADTVIEAPTPYRPPRLNGSDGGVVSHGAGQRRHGAGRTVTVMPSAGPAGPIAPA